MAKWVAVISIVLTGWGTQAALPTPDQMKLLKLPPGFSIAVVGVAENARQLALSPSGTLFIGSRDAGNVSFIPDAVAKFKKKGGKPAVAQLLARGLIMPSGVVFHGGALYVAATSQILKFPDIEKNLKEKAPSQPLATTFPKDTHHGWKHIELGPDGLLYVPVGAPCNICLSEDPIYASITRMTLEGKNREIVAHGVRNTLGLDWHPDTKELWFSDNGRDLWGDDRPGDELNRVAKAGDHFGYPFCHDMGLKDPEFGGDKNCEEGKPYKQPALKLAPHTAALGIKFYRGKQFPDAYRGRIFIAEHGSWNRGKKMGYRVMMADPQGGKATNYRPFIEGWLQNEKAWGRPAYILEMPDGSLLVSDDHAGVIYRVTYSDPRPASKK